MAMHALQTSPESFDFIDEPAGSALVARPWCLAVAGALLDRTDCTPVSLGGRGEVWRFPLPEGHGIVRPYRRGGLMRLVLHNAFFLKNRPLHEFRVHLYLYRSGLAVPEPLGVAWRRRGLLFSGALATRELTGRHLQDYLAAAPRYPEDTLRRVGSLIRELHDAGVYHADLQVRNVFVGVDRVYLMDFDRARRRTRLSKLSRARNLLRLRRSFAKSFLPQRFFDLVREGYGDLRLPLWLRAGYALKARLSDGLAGRR